MLEQVKFSGIRGIRPAGASTSVAETRNKLRADVMDYVEGGSPTFVYGNVRHYVALHTLVQLVALTPSAARVEIEIAAIIAE